jgi:hypothetical protein
MQTRTEPLELTRRFTSVMAGHAELRAKEKLRLQTILDQLVPGFLAERKKWALAQRALANDFNLFEVIHIQGDEVRHSKLLAWLLDHRIERGTHAQGNLGFRLFLKEFARELQLDDRRVELYGNEPHYWVHTEVSGAEARVDIEIAARGKFLIHLENKIYSMEGEDQTNREWTDLQARRKEFRVNEEACHAIFLTLDGHEAINKNFHSIGWNRVAKVLEEFAEQAEPPEVKLFAGHYAKVVRKLCIIERELTEDVDANV